MDFKDQIKMLSERVIKLKENLQTEEATKNALIMPFIQALGYDVFDPTEVIPEYTCDLGIKKGEKIDYAICKDGAPIILVECKHWKENLNSHNNQLFRYFHASNARFGILTNGVVYRFYTDLVEKNKMDEKPFFEFNMEQYRGSQVSKLKEFHKSYFDIDAILNTASELKYTNEIRNAIAKEVAEPSDDFVKYFAKPVYSGRLNGEVLEQFKTIVKSAFAQYCNDYMNERLKSAIGVDAVVSPAPATEQKQESPAEQVEEASKVQTTDEEMAGFRIVQAICYAEIDNIERIVSRDTQSYFGILLDDNNRKPICRLHFNTANKYIEVFDESRIGTKHLINSLSDIYKYQAQIISALKMY
ncbi:MAG: type I restriction enzyme HsdR N-terminal domain-containing protein [Alistipes sp.]|nr:type I restriction enzyme HsdR N-terminal domain-containing protein [Alistipes sp.]